jgi:alginate O-acetyltransferase complex protein AlgI
VFVLLAYFFPRVKQSINTNINLLVTMLLGGLWHGSSWLFIIWGGLNGLGLVIHKLWQKLAVKFVPYSEGSGSGVKTSSGGKAPFALKAFWVFVTLTFISFTRIFFRSDSLDTVSLIFDRISNHLGLELIFEVIRGYWVVFMVIAIGYLIHWIPERVKQQYRETFAGMPLPAMAITVLIAIFCIYQLISGEMQPFIYFQF